MTALMNRVKSHNVALRKRLLISFDHNNQLLQENTRVTNKLAYELVGLPHQDSPARHITRRDDETITVEALQEICENPDRGIFLLTGPSGIGKTSLLCQTLLQNARTSPVSSSLINQNVREKLVLVLWLNCSKYFLDSELPDEEKQEDNFGHDLIDLARQADDQFDHYDPTQITAYFTEKKNYHRVLFVFDGLKQDAGKKDTCCIVTANLEYVKSGANVQKKIHRLGELTTDEMKDVLDTKSGFRGRLQHSQVLKLTEACCGLPLMASLIAGEFRELDEMESWEAAATHIISNLGELPDAEAPISKRQYIMISSMLQYALNELHRQWRKCYYCFLIFNPDEFVDIRDLAVFWSCYSDVSGENIANFLDTRSLVTRSGDRSKIAIHHLLHEATLEQACFDLKLTLTDGDFLQNARLKLITCAGVEGEHILFKAVKAERIHLLKMLIMKLSAQELGQLCKKHGDVEKTLNDDFDAAPLSFLHFLYAYEWQIKTPNNGNPSFEILREILVKLTKLLRPVEVLQIVNAPSGRDTSFLYEILADEHKLEDEDGRSSLTKLVNRWRFVYEEWKWRRHLKSSKSVKKNVIAALHGIQDVMFNDLMMNRRATSQDFHDTFMTAARAGQTETVAIINRISQTAGSVEEGSVIPLRDQDYEEGLLLATAAGHVDVVQWFVTTKGPGILSQSVLSIASENGHYSLVEFICSQRAELAGEQNDDGQAPLWMAAKNGYLRIVQLLWEKSPESAVLVDKNNINPLWIASQHGHVDVVMFLFDKDASSAEKQDAIENRSSLWVAADEGHGDVVKFLGEFDTKLILRTNKHEETPLHAAARNGHLDIVRYLAKKTEFRFWTSRDQTGASAIFRAAEHGHLDIVRFLFDKSNNSIVQKDKTGATPLWVATANRHIEVVRFICRKAPDTILVADSSGQSPIWLAAGYADGLAMVKTMCSIDPRAADLMVLRHARQCGHQNIVQFLEKEIAKQFD